MPTKPHPVPPNTPPACVHGLTDTQYDILWIAASQGGTFVAKDVSGLRGVTSPYHAINDLRARDLVMREPGGQGSGYKLRHTLQAMQRWMVEDFVATRLNGDAGLLALINDKV